MASESNEVKLRCYDLSRGMASTISSIMNIECDAIWHTGVLVNGQEIFWSGNINRESPGVVEADYGMAPKVVIPLGTTKKSGTEIEAFLAEFAHKFNETTYNLISNNCNHFSDYFAKFLLDTTEAVVPAHIINQHEILRSHPQGAKILDMLENLGDGTISNPFRSRGSPVDTSPPYAAGSAAASLSQSVLNEIPRSAKCINDPIVRENFTNCIDEGNEAIVVLPIVNSICENICKNVTNEKYRSLSKSSKKLALIIGNANSKKLFLSLGFEEVDDHYVLPKVQKSDLLKMIQLTKAIGCYLNPDRCSTKQPVESEPLPHLFNQNVNLSGLLGGNTPEGIDMSTIMNSVSGLALPLLNQLAQQDGTGSVPSGELSALSQMLQTDPNQIRDTIGGIFNDSEMMRGLSTLAESPEIRNLVDNPAIQNLMRGDNLDVADLASAITGPMRDLMAAGGLNSQGRSVTPATTGTALPNNAMIAELVERLKEMGYVDEEKCKKALKKANNNISRALDYLMDDDLD